MKSFFKKSVISLFVMGIAGTSFAASHATVNTCGGAWSPSFTGWFIGVDGLWLKPMNGDLDYITLFPASGISGGSFYTQNIDTDYQWSWRFYGGFKFTDNDDITLSWLRMRADDSDSVNIPEDNTSAPIFLPIATWNSASAHVDFDLDEVYGVWGHTIHFNNPWDVRFAAGLEYAKLNSDLTIGATDISSDFDGVGFQSDSHFRGFGPRFEFDMTYHLPCNFALFADANAALLVSTRKISLVANNAGLVDDEGLGLVSSYYSTRHVVVPKFGARLGLSYTWIFGQCGGEGGAASALTIDAGWQVDTYVHAIERPSIAFAEFEALQAFGSATFEHTQVSNFGDSGFFIGLKYSSGVV